MERHVAIRRWFSTTGRACSVVFFFRSRLLGLFPGLPVILPVGRGDLSIKYGFSCHHIDLQGVPPLSAAQGGADSRSVHSGQLPNALPQRTGRGVRDSGFAGVFS